MDRSRVAQGLAVILVLTAGLVLFSKVSEAVAQDCLEGRAFSVLVTRRDGFQFPDTYCFADNSMTVETIGCMSGSAVTICVANEAIFVVTVGGVAFIGEVRGSTIEGNAIAGGGREGTAFGVGGHFFTFAGSEVGTCPCPTPSGAQEETNPYLP